MASNAPPTSMISAADRNTFRTDKSPDLSSSPMISPSTSQKEKNEKDEKKETEEEKEKPKRVTWALNIPGSHGRLDFHERGVSHSGASMENHGPTLVSFSRLFSLCAKEFFLNPPKNQRRTNSEDLLIRGSETAHLMPSFGGDDTLRDLPTVPDIGIKMDSSDEKGTGNGKKLSEEVPGHV